MDEIVTCAQAGSMVLILRESFLAELDGPRDITGLEAKLHDHQLLERALRCALGRPSLAGFEPLLHREPRQDRSGYGMFRLAGE
ncbi:hypothetical protein C5E06_09490 [Pseudoclavibacter sp. RFBI5]|nr:hypothetical protein C5E06_09490 [Pseudoclavibacter sp. RFBI5]